MKKFSLILVVLLLFVSLTGCAMEGAENSADGTSNSSSSEVELAAYPFEYDPYVLPVSVKEQLGDFFEPYKKAVDAVRERSEDFSVSSRSEYDAVIGVLNEYFPPFALVTETAYDTSSNKAKLSYRYDQETHEYRVQLFENAQAFAANVALKEGDGDVAKALSLYYYATSAIYENKRETNMLEPFTDSTADHNGYAVYLNQMFLQVGIDSICVEVTDVNQLQHKMVMAKLDGNVYYFDPYSELASSTGYGLVCFGMSDKDLKTFGFGEGARLLTGLEAPLDVPAAGSDRFSAMRNCANWTMNTDRQSILMTVEGVKENWGPFDE